MEQAAREEGRTRGGESPRGPNAVGLRQVALTLLGFVGIVAFTWYRGHIDDYGREVAPAVNALAGGDFWGAVQRQANIPPFSILLRAPIVAVVQHFGGGGLVSYRAGAVPCVGAAALLGVALVKWFPSSSRPRALGWLVVLLAVATPAAADALDFGHPEEILGAALSVGAVAACLSGRNAWGALLLGLALSTKQWALLAVGPAMLAAGRTYWWRVTAAAAALTALLLLPLLLADQQHLAAATREAASAPAKPLFLSWWYLLHHDLPSWLPQYTKPGIVLSAIPLTLLAYWRGCGADRALPLMALLFIIRCVFDPQTQYYYHLPLLLTLLAWDVQKRRRLPYASLAALAALVITNSYLASPGGLYTASVFYFCWTSALAAYLVVVLVRRPRVADVALAAKTA